MWRERKNGGKKKISLFLDEWFRTVRSWKYQKYRWNFAPELALICIWIQVSFHGGSFTTWPCQHFETFQDQILTLNPDKSWNHEFLQMLATLSRRWNIAFAFFISVYAFERSAKKKKKVATFFFIYFFLNLPAATFTYWCEALVCWFLCVPRTWKIYCFLFFYKKHSVDANRSIGYSAKLTFPIND